MTATFAEFAFSAAFLMMMNTCLVFTMLSEEESLRAIRMIGACFGSAFIMNFLPSEDGQAASQPGPMISVISQPVVRIAS